MPPHGSGATSIDVKKRLAALGVTRLAKAEVFPLSSAQQRLWLADQTLPGTPAYHLVRVIDLDGHLDVRALNAALGEIVARHEALRTSVIVVAGQPMQRVAGPAAAELPVIAATEAAAGELATAAARRRLDLAGGPLWRAELHRLGSARHRLVLVFHHIIADAATIAMLLSELAAAYRAFHAGEAPELPPAVPYRAYVTWERSFATDPDCARQLSYWRSQLAGCEPAGLPAELPRPVTPQRPAARVPVRIPAMDAYALRDLARTNGATLTQLVLAGYAVVLHRCGGRTSFTIGMPVSTRHDRRWTHSAGLYVATLPIRVSLAGNPTFTELLRQVRSTVLAALGAADVPLEWVADSPGPLYDVTFGMVQDNGPAFALPELTCRMDRVYAGRAKFDLHLEIADPGPGGDLEGLLEYDAELFGPGTARHLTDGIVTLLHGVATTPDQRIGHLPLWPDAWPGTREVDEGPAGARVDRLFAEVAGCRPEHVALVDAVDGQELTYAELAARARAVASVLAARGIRRGDFVGIALTRSVDMVAAVLGVLTAGAAYVPLDPGYPVSQLSEMIGRSAVKLVIGAALPGQSVPVIDVPAAGETGQPAPAGAGGDPAYVMFTSGSTGQPKAVVVPHRAVIRLVRGSGFASMTSGERWLHAASPAFDAATLELWAPLLNGGTVVVLPGQPTVASLAQAIHQHHITSAFLTTGLFNLVVDTDPEALRPLRQLVIGGEAASADHVRRALAVVGTVVNGYGPTENTTFTTCHPMHDPAQVATPVPLGTPVNGTTVRIVDGYGHEVPAGLTGEILTGGQGLALGYAGAPALTAERFVPSPSGPPGARLYRTGDYGRIGADGLVHFAGRRDGQVKVRGFRIELDAIEQAAMAHPDVAQAAVTVHTDPSGDRRLVGYLVGTADGPALPAHLAGLLPPYMIPSQWITLPELPLGPTGKVDRRALPAPEARSVRPARPSTVAEELLIAWYAELLGLADVTPDTDFFAVGGHSLLASRLAARIRARLGVDLPLGTVFGNPRLADLAAAITTLERTGLPPLLPRGGHELPLSFAQERMWFLQRYAPASAQYHVPIAIDLTGDLDTTALAGAVQAVAGRHPMLRAVFGERDSQPYQRILPAGTPIAMPLTDLTGLAPGLRQAALGQLAAAVFTEPFDLTASPPIRAALVRMDTGRHRLLLVIHHLVADGWSLPLIYRDLAAAYAGPGLSTAPELTYGDFAAWQREALSGPATERLTRYWQETLKSAPTRLELDGDLTGPPGGEPGGGVCRLRVPADVASQIREVGRQAGATPFATLLAAFAVLLSRHTPQRDLVIGTPAAGRGDAALTDMVGLFLNTLPLRIDASGEPAFSELIRRVRGTVVAGLEHADLPFERIVELAGVPRTSGHQPLVQVLFALQPAISSHFTLGEVAAEVQPAHHGTAKFDLTMSLFDDGEGFSGFIEYRTDRFSPAYAAAFAAEFTELLGHLAGDPSQPVATYGRALTATVPPHPSVPAPAVTAAGPADAPAGQTALSGPEPHPTVLSAPERHPTVLSAPERHPTVLSAPERHPTAGIETEIGRIWERLLGVPAGPDTNFFAVGGHSLAAMRVIAELRGTHGRDVPLRDLFDHPTLGAFAARVTAAPPVTARPPLRSSQTTGPAPLTAEQERHWVLYQLEPDSPAQNVPMVWRLRGPLDVAALREALTLVSVRQAVLRTTFETSGGVPAQRVGPPTTVSLPVVDITTAALDDALRREAECPFDLTAAPPWRATLLRLAADDHYLLLTLHHIICDGWSMPVLLTELAACYADGPAASLPPLHVQYADYARWQQNWLRADGSEYWTRQLRGVPALCLPTDRRRPASPSHRSGEIEILINGALRAKLESLATSEGTTLFAVLLAVFATVLGRYSGQSDFAIGTFHANRDDTAIQRLIGYFVNNLALRCDLSANPTWRQLIGRLRATIADAYTHAAIPFEQVIRDLRVDRQASQTPVFQAMLVLQNLPPLPGKLGPLDLTVIRRPYDRADFDLTLWLREDAAGALTGGLIHDADIFTHQTATTLTTLFHALLNACLETPDTLIANAARPQLPAPAKPKPGPPLAHRFATQAAATPDATALIWPTPDGPATLTYADLVSAATHLATRLRDNGAAPESRVAVYLPRSAAAVVAFLAVAQADAAYVPLDPDYPAQRIAGLLSTAHADLLVTSPTLRDQVALPLPTLELPDPEGSTGSSQRRSAQPAVAAPSRCLPATSDNSLAYVIFTSGSTGHPKPVLVTSKNLSAYLDSITAALDLSPADRILAFAATTFDAITEELYPALLSGASVVLRPQDVRVPDATFDALLEQTRPTVLSLPVTFWHAWVDRLAREDGQVPAYLRMLLLNAEEPSVHRYRQWCAAGGAHVRFVNTYGPTEATVTASLYEPGPGATAHEEWDRFPIGTTLDGVTAQILDPTGRPVPDGAVGELCLGGAGVTRGYGGQPGLTAAAYWPDAYAAEPGSRIYRTGDLVRRLPDGTLMMLGRGDRQVKIRGHRVELGEVEAALAGHPDVAQAAVLTTGTGEFRQLVAYLATTGPELTEEEVRGYLAERLPPFMVPARLPILPVLPLTPNRKVDRRALAARLDADLAAHPAGDGRAAAATAGPAAPGTPAQRTLHGIWCAVLGRAAVGVHDNFFGIGGDSIRGLQIVTQAREAGLDLTVRDLFDRQTIAGLAELAGTRPPAGAGLPGDEATAVRPPAGAAARVTGLTDSQLRGALARLSGPERHSTALPSGPERHPTALPSGPERHPTALPSGPERHPTAKLRKG